MKKKLIVPVDFSATSHNAYLFARGLAADCDATIEVVHVHTTTPGEKASDIAGEIEKLKKQLQDFLHLYPGGKQGQETTLTKVKVSSRLLEGLPIKSILRLTEFHPSDSLIVMGMTGTHNAPERWLGTISSSVAQKAACPVLLIPKGAKYAPFKSILYASNYESADPLKVKQVTMFAEFFKSTIHFIHVREKSETEDFTETEKRIFEQLFASGDPDFSFNMAAIDAQTVMDGLNQYASENNIDLITLVNNQRGFIESLFGQSMTKNNGY